MRERDRFEASLDKRANVKHEESSGNVADSMDVRRDLMMQVHCGQITLQEAQDRLKQIQRDAKKNGMKTRSQAFNEG